MTVASVLILRGVSSLYDYYIPANHLHIRIGEHVQIPFGNTTSIGLVMALSQKESHSELKSILSIADGYPCVSSDLVALIQWFYTHYLCTPLKAYQTIIGPAKSKIKPLSKTRKSISPTPVKSSPYTLTKDQTRAFDAIQNATAGSEIMLLGVTGSGKTEVYLRAAELALKNGFSTLILLPEIALTPQTRRHFESRFGNVVSVIHSGLTPKQRRDEWYRINEGIAKIVIGPRSAIFCPLSHIGYIIIDEAHDASYKQETHPRYATLAVARARQQHTDCILITGSATPDITDYHHLQKNKAGQIITLQSRVNQQDLPAISVINFRDEIQSQATGVFSQPFLLGLESTLARKEKAMVLVNRRGYAPYIACSRCSHIATCPNCELSYTFHHDQSFRCHRCFIKIPATRTCKQCGKSALIFGGMGIQKVETELQKLFPNTTICRIDKDTAGTIQQLETQLNQFSVDGQIMIGTQMIAKGHHFPEVTWVGVLGIDTLLNMPDFRAPERVFQLLTQVSGRAGRGDKPGHVLIQTLQPEHYAIRHASRHDFLAFYEEELNRRKGLNYPPFGHLINFIISSQSDTDARAYSDLLRRHLEILQSDTLQILGPAPAPFEKINTYFRYHVLIKLTQPDNPQINSVFASIPSPPKQVRCIPDIDPLSIL